MATGLGKKQAAELAALEARHELETLGAEFVAAKKAGTADRALRAALREATREYRLNVRTPVPGSVQPSTVKAKVN